ncbi:MAG: bifunctional glutamate N-acetyltransferase/amino-acid acetyltransferase ArgJ [Clostridiales bacterium]|nr:bifunctional glutamate N-acetyltransferase/amino-acid acetyltransferase ArgJ [Clostridiales bacterium]MDY4172210.1 bifunctional glutamate N-acetyltransferase/amino-acid acetyltransferase ArgJ [Evtepia sp.]
MNIITGGVTAPKGFKAAGLHCGIKDNFTTPQPEKKDLAMILSEVPCAAAGTYTRNVVKADPVILTKEHLADHKAQGIIFDSGNANACAPKGMENAQRMAQAAAAATGLQPQDFAVCSTGIIGVELNIDAIEKGVPALVASLADTPEASSDAAHAILTTDLKVKEIAVTVELGGKTVTLGAIAKGSGMIHPNMGTMLCGVTTDCAIDGQVLQTMLREVVSKTFNRITVDGDTSTNDTCVVLANGLAGNPTITGPGPDYDTFCAALRHVCEYEAKMIASDGEGAGRLITCTVQGAESEEQAELMAKAVVRSPLVKCAVFGTDANWGRVLCAVGYSGAAFDPKDVEVKFLSQAGQLLVCSGGQGVPFDEDVAKTVLSQDEVVILVTLTAGTASCSCWGCDLTYDYVKINGDYRS